MAVSESPQIAVIGVAAELPGGPSGNLDAASFFAFLVNKCQAYEKIPADRFNMEYMKGQGLGQVITDTGTFLKDIQFFDYLEFGITNRDVRAMSVSTRKLIETSFMALLDSGIKYKGENVGCYMAGVSLEMFAISGHDDNEVRGSFAGGPSTIANRVSYHLDLRGPSIPLDTACSSSVHAIHLAVQALRDGDCEAAVVGGAQFNHRYTDWAYYSQGGMLSPDGKCKPFDISADGFGRGEGVVCIVLKPLEAAIRDQDKIYATILGTGINSSGSLAPVNAPVASTQQDAMKRAFRVAKRLPPEVDYVELHGTGTAVGDPTEVNWVGEQFERDGELLIGSVKGNIGHLEVAAFLSAFCKVCFMLKTQLIPPNVNLKIPNPAIKWDRYKLRVPVDTERLPCRSPSGRSLIAMTSTNITGNNGHCVVEGPPITPHSPNGFWIPGSAIPALLIAAGLTPRSASAVGNSLQELATDHHPHSLARIYGRRSRSLTWRSYILAGGSSLSPFPEPVLTPKSRPPLVFVFSGQGPQHLEMGRQLFTACAPFRSTILELDDVHTQVTGYSLIERYGLFSDVSGTDVLGEIWPIAVTLPALAMLHISLFDTLASIGVKPDVVVGHSAGETAVLYASGSASKAEALKLAIARGKAMSLLEDAQGTMAAVSCTPEEAHGIIADVLQEIGPGSLEIGCYNSTSAVTLSGESSHVDLAVSKAQAQGIFARRLRTRIPVHSPMMKLCETEYRSLVTDVFEKHGIAKPAVKTYSTMTGGHFDGPFTPEYFWESTHGPVLFTQAVESLAACHPNATYVEISPHPVLSSYLSSLAGQDATVISPLRRPKDPKLKVEVRSLLEALGKLVVSGHNIVDFDGLYGGLGDDIEPPLLYPFSRKDIPYCTPTDIIKKQKQPRNGPLNYSQLQINAKTHPGLADHIIKDEPIMPAAGYVEMALEFGARHLWNVEFVSILTLSSERATPVQVELDKCKWTVKSASPTSLLETRTTVYDRVHATGYLSIEPMNNDHQTLDLSRIRERLCPIASNMQDFYQGFTNFAQYGPRYQRIIECYYGVNDLGQDEVLARVRGDDIDLPDIGDYRIHPAVLDAAIHATVHPILTGYNNDPRYFLPSKLGAVHVHETLLKRPFPKSIFSLMTLVRSTPDTLVYNVALSDEEGAVMLTMELENALHGSSIQRVTKRHEVVSVETGIIVGRNTKSNGAPIQKHEIPSLVLSYARGREMELKEIIAPLDALTPHCLWFHATAGLDGDASLGFTRSLRREYPLWTVRVVVFDQSWTPEGEVIAMQGLCSHPECEVELYVGSTGMTFAPRIAESPPPSLRTAFDPQLPWIQEGSHIVHVSEPLESVHHSTIVLSGATAPNFGLWAYIGCEKRSLRRVGGITFGPLTSTVIAHEGSLVDLPDDSSRTTPDLLAHAIVGLALNGMLYRAERLRVVRVAVDDSDHAVASQVLSLCTALGIQPIIIPNAPSVSELKLLFESRPDVVISGDRGGPHSQVYTDALSPGGKVLFWRDVGVGIPYILSTDPWVIGDAIRSSMTMTTVPGSYSCPLELTGIISFVEVEFRRSLFSNEKAYLLVGGIGSLGVEIAYWMYKHGARYIVLTSRSGRDSVKKCSKLSRRLLSYLEVLPDLSLHLIKVDATSVKEMSQLVEDLPPPIGGCMLLSVVLKDRTFTMQDGESFEAVFPPKTGAFSVLERIMPIQKLDFLITFSSVSGMFGNAGQTNYASANAALAGMTKKYSNAFCIIVPAILDSSIATLDNKLAGRISHLTNWGISSAQLCEYIGDGIMKIWDGPIWQYVPDFDWNVVQANMGPSTMYGHLTTEEFSSAGPSMEVKRTTFMKDVVCKVLDVPSNDLSADVPFTAYGLDSLSAASLSLSLAPILRVSQLQLLADLTLRDLEEKLNTQAEDLP